MPKHHHHHQHPPEPPFKKDEKVLCLHLDLLYEAKIIEVLRDEDDSWLYKVHYKGWKASWDDWATQDRIRKWTPENQELAQTLLAQRKKAADKSKSGGKKSVLKSVASATGAGSEIGSGRGSEERGSGTVTSSGRGPRRYRDYELEQVSLIFSFPPRKHREAAIAALAMAAEAAEAAAKFSTASPLSGEGRLDRKNHKMSPA